KAKGIPLCFRRLLDNALCTTFDNPINRYPFRQYVSPFASSFGIPSCISDLILLLLLFHCFQIITRILERSFSSIFVSMVFIFAILKYFILSLIISFNF